MIGYWLPNKKIVSAIQTLITHRCVLLAVVIGVVRPEIGHFWHVTDPHVDSTYTGAAMSCHDNTTPENRGMFGNELCDAPWSLINSSAYAMKTIAPNVDFIIWTGDNAYHPSEGSPDPKTDVVLGIVDNITSLLRDVFPGVTTYPALGNHDYYPDSQFPSHDNEIYRHLEMTWRDWVNDPSFSTTFRRGGYYTTLIRPGLRMVSLNTNLYNTRNLLAANFTDADDPAGQFQWFNETLTSATRNNEKVIVIAHIITGLKGYMGFLWMYEQYNDMINKVISEHMRSGVIIGIHFGHAHDDEFKIYYDKQGTPRIPVFIAPSVTPWRYKTSEGELGRAHHPGIRLVSYDRTSGRHLDVKQYYLDIKKANKNGFAKWELLYKATGAYDIPDVTAGSLSKARDMILSSERHAQDYFNRLAVMGANSSCDDTCRFRIYCGMGYFDMAGFQKCIQKQETSSAIKFISSAGVLAFVTSLVLLLH